MRTQRIVAFMILLAACKGESNPTGTDGFVPTTLVYKSKTSGIAGRRAEIISRQTPWIEAWDQITAGMSPNPALPNVNFDDSILIFVAGGELADSCGDVRIESVNRVDGALEVSIIEERRPNCSCPAVVVRPVHIVSAPRAATGASFTFTVTNLNTCS